MERGTPLTKQIASHEWSSDPCDACALLEACNMVSRTSELHHCQNGKGSLLRNRVQLPPGYRLTAIARFVLPSSVFKRYVWPTIADMQLEYIEALNAGHVWHARWIALRGHMLVIPGWVYALLAGRLHALFGPRK